MGLIWFLVGVGVGWVARWIYVIQQENKELKKKKQEAKPNGTNKK